MEVSRDQFTDNTQCETPSHRQKSVNSLHQTTNGASVECGMQKQDPEDVTGDDRLNDSGYVSLDNSPRRPNLSQDEIFDEIALVKHRLLPLRTRTKLKSFGETISPEYLRRFADLRELLGPALNQRLTRSSNYSQHGPIAMNVRVLGADEASAKPWIVILCAPRISRTVQQFFKETWVKSECEPGNERPDVPSFQVVVHARAPLLAAGYAYADVFGGLSPNGKFGDTLCGSIIRLESRLATIGGMIQIGSTAQYSMTVGHILNTVLDSDPLSNSELQSHANSFNDEEEDTVEDDGYELYELDIDQDRNRPEDITFEDSRSATNNIDDRSWPRIRRLMAFSNEDHLNFSRRNLDWALVSLDMHEPRPNILRNPQGLDSHLWSGRYNLQSNKDLEVPVLLLSGLRGKVRGRLNSSASSISIGTGDNFTTTYIVRLEDYSGLKPGECGSWVINPETGYVFGHAVASDLLGDIYVIPLDAILDDISWQFKKPVILLPTHQIAHTNAADFQLLGDADIDRDGHDLENLGYGTFSDIAFPESRHGIPGFPSDATTDSGYASMNHSPNMTLSKH